MKTWADFGIEITGPPDTNGERKERCPECTPGRKREHQREKDLSVNITKGTWHCWNNGCDFKGSLGTGESKYNPPTLLLTTASDKDRLYTWFEKRGITRETVDKHQVITHKTDKGTAIAFQHFRDGVHIHTAFRALSDKKICWQDTGTERIFYGLDDITPDTRAIAICEGHPDKLAWSQVINMPVLSVPDGAAVGESKLSYLASAVDVMERMERVYLALDNDQPGKELMQELARRIGIGKCFVVDYPDGCKDGNDVLLLPDGDAKLLDLILNAQPYPIDGVYTVDAIFEGAEDYLTWGDDEGVRVGLPDLDENYRPTQGTVTVLTGHSGHGKSEWLDQYMILSAQHNDWAFAIFSPENMPPLHHAIELAEILLQKTKGNFFWGEHKEVKEFLNDHFVYVLPDQYTIDAILERMRICVLQYGVKGCVIDPWNMLESERPRDVSETEYVSRVMTKITEFAKHNGVHIWLVAHPAKYNNYYSKDEHEPVPTLNDISTSGNFRNKADFGVVIWRDIHDERVPALVAVQKVRHRTTGRVGRSYYLLNHTTRTMREVPPPPRTRLTFVGREDSS